MAHAPTRTTGELLEGISPALFSHLEESIIPSPHSIDLVRSPLSDYLYRQVRRTPHVAELFHENSKVTPSSTMQPAASYDDIRKVKDWFFASSYDVPEEDILTETPDFRITVNELPAPLDQLFAPFAQEGRMADLLYAVDLLVVGGDHLFRMSATKPYLFSERPLASEDHDALARAFGMESAAGFEGAHVVLLVGCPWRQMFFHGPRGYRHTLFDVGRLLWYVEATLGTNGIRTGSVQDFHDTAVDDFAQCDGLERSVMAAALVSHVSA